MHPALQGALVGLGIGVVLFIFEYLALNKQVNERAKKYNKVPVFDVTETSAPRNTTRSPCST